MQDGELQGERLTRRQASFLAHPFFELASFLPLEHASSPSEAGLYQTGLLGFPSATP
jgi:hypothetical protein